ncbi:unnamed protein product [Phytophthora lilii]|uniref:Unnamed protein product n=1 Tax=Phytophthora lilii TaxID=2077276 RepID=A0A9W6WVI6_9STRA|nr:unnamed protein product [Phytophthora lilii]
MSQLLEKELQSHEELRRAHAELQGEHRKLQEQVTLLNQVLDSVESKHAELTKSHTTLTTSYEAAQTTIETLQCEVLVMQNKLATSDTHVQVVTEYEDKIQQWERTCHELERKCENKMQKLFQTQKLASAAQEEAQRALHRQEELEQEVHNAHDQMIQANAIMRTMEAKLEANLKSAQRSGSQESAFPYLLRRLDALQDQCAAAVESNDILKSALEQMQDPPLDVSSWIKPGELVDETSRAASCISGSMYLHLARDKYLLESPYPIELLCDQTVARALSGCSTSTTSFTGVKKKTFVPFRVMCKAIQLKENQHQETEDQLNQLFTLSADSNDTSGASYLNRSNINAFLEVIQSSAARKKFKSLVIGKLAECLNKLRELAHRSSSESAAQNASIQLLQREVADLQQKLKRCQSDHSETNADGHATSMKSSQQLFKARQFLLKMVDVYAEKQQDNDHRQMTFLTQPLSSDMLIANAHSSYNDNSKIPDDRLCLADSGLEDEDVGQLLLKILVSGVRFREIILDSNNLSDVGAQHVADFLEKILGGVQVVSLAGNNRITQRGIDLIRRGLLQNQCVQRVREDERKVENGVVLLGLALDQNFQVNGKANEIFRIVLPMVSRVEESELKHATSEDVDALTEKLRQLGFRYNIRQPSRPSRVRSTTTSSSKKLSTTHQDVPQPRSFQAAPSINTNRRASLPSNRGTSFNRRPVSRSSENSINRRRSLPSSSVNNDGPSSQRQQIKQQQDLRYKSLEAAIQRASAPHSRAQVLLSALADALAVDADDDIVLEESSPDSEADAESKVTSGSMPKLPEPTSAALLSELRESSLVDDLLLEVAESNDEYPPSDSSVLSGVSEGVSGTALVCTGESVAEASVTGSVVVVEEIGVCVIVDGALVVDAGTSVAVSGALAVETGVCITGTLDGVAVVAIGASVTASGVETGVWVTVGAAFVGTGASVAASGALVAETEG